MVVRLAGVVLVQLVELGVGLVAEGLAAHSAEVEVEAVQQEVDFNPRPSGLRTHSRRRTQDEEGAVHRAAGLVLSKIHRWTALNAARREHERRRRFADAHVDLRVSRGRASL